MHTLSDRSLKIILGFLLASLFGLYVYNNDFKLGFQPDEPKKVRYILNDGYDFQHPMLILQTVKIVNSIPNYTDEQNTVVLARYTTAVYATLSVLLVFLITLTITGNGWFSLLACTLYGVTPGLAVHAHHIKEDVALTAFLLLTIYSILKKWRSRFGFVPIGACYGLALSSHHKSIAFILLILLLPFLFRKKTYAESYLYVAWIILVACAVYSIINYPLFTDFEQFARGIIHETKHVHGGHTLALSFHVFPFFYIREDFVPSMGLLFTIVSIAIMIISILHSRGLNNDVKLIVLFTLTFYMIVEISPLKNERYILPVIPGLAILVCCAFSTIADTRMKSAATLLVISACLQPAYLSFNVIEAIDNDTRYQVTEKMKNVDQKKIHWGRYSNGAIIEPKEKFMERDDYNDKDYLILSSFMYSRYLFGEHLDGQKPDIAEKAQRFKKYLDAYEVETLEPRFSYSFVNPTIKIIKLNEPKQRK